MSKIVKRSIVFILLFLISFSIVPVNAVNLNDSVKADIRLVTFSRLNNFTNSNNSYADDSGLVYYLTNLLNTSLWFEYAVDNTDVEIKASEVTDYYNYIKSSISKFNNTFSETKEGLSFTCSIPIPQTQVNGNKDTYKSYIDELIPNLLQVSQTMLDKYYSKILNEYNSASSDEDKEAVLSTDPNRTIIKAVYNLCARPNQEREDILSLYRLYQADGLDAYTYDRNISSLVSLLDNDKYSVIVEYARKIIETDIITSNDEQEMEGDTPWQRYLSKMDGYDTSQVNSHFLKVMACSSIYQPFVDKLGNETFIECLKSIDEDELAVETYKKIYLVKKPLYYRATKTSGVGKGNAERITVKDFLDLIEDNDSGALYTVKGSFQRSEDNDMFEVRKGDGTEVYADDGEFVDGDDSSNSNNSNSNNSNSNNSNSSTTPTITKTETKSDGTKVETYSNGTVVTTKTDGSVTAVDKDGNSTTVPNSSSTNVTNTDGVAGAQVVDDNGETTLLTQTLTDTDILTDAVFSFGEDFKHANTNLILMYNILKDSKIIDSIEGLNKRFLYINPFGDIVLDDNTVVVPAAANANFYKGSKTITDLDNVDLSTPLYNPNTAAFMNSYPKASNTNKMFSASKRDRGKYIIAHGISMVSNNDNETEADFSMYGLNTRGPTEDSDVDTVGYIISGDGKGIKVNQVANACLPIDTTIMIDGVEKIPTMRSHNYSFDTSIGSFFSGIRTTLQGYNLVVPETATTFAYGSNVVLFPLTGDAGDSDFVERCKLISQNFYNSMSMNTEGEIVGLNKRYDREYITSIFKEAYNGLSNIAIFVKNSMENYTDAELDELNGLEKFLMNMADSVLEVTGQNSGAIGLKNAYQDKIFGKFLYYSKEYLSIIIVVIVLFFIVRFARRKVNAIYATAGVIFSAFCVIFALQIVPVYLPSILNEILNNTSDSLGYKALYMRQEKYQDPFDTKIGYNDQGEFSLGTCSMTLYKLDNKQIEDICKYMDTDESAILGGSALVLDETSGLFVQGDSIKINIDRIFASLSITGKYNTSTAVNSYEITSKKYYSNNLDYYTPYYLFVDQFIGKLNKFVSLYNIPNSQLTYPGGRYKDSFVVDTYVQSDLFLNGADLSCLEDQFGTDLYKKAIDNSMFGKNNLDFLGLTELFTSYVDDNYDVVKETLWFQSMVREGYYDMDGNIEDKDLLARLIEQVNSSVKEYLIDMEGEMPYISDENLIKCTSLYALTEFNRIVSGITNCMYPQSLNYEEFSIEDIMLPILAKDYDRYMAVNQDLVNYVYSDFGWLGLMLFMVVCIESWVIVNIMTWGTPLIYIILLYSIVARFTFKKSEHLKSVFTGYIRVFGSIFVCYYLFCKLTALAHSFNNTRWTLAILMFIYSLFLVILLTVLFALVTSLFDLGSTKVNTSLRNLGSKILKKLHLNNLITELISTIKKGRGRGPIDLDKYAQYSYTTGVDDLYGDAIYNDIMDERYEGFNEHYGHSNKKNSRKTIRQRRKGKVQKEYDSHGDYVSYIDDERDEYDKYRY